MTTQIIFTCFTQLASSSTCFTLLASSRNIVRRSLILLLCATPLAAFAQTPPSAPGSAAAPTFAENLSVTPKFGQTQEQLAADRAECQGWAKGQTGFDPTQFGGGAGPSDYNGRRQRYGRALAACLEGHGYNVHFAAPITAPPAYSPPPPPPPVALTHVHVRDYSRPPELKYHPFAVQIDGGYTATTGTAGDNLDGGSNVGLGLSWFPTSALPIGLRVDGSYSWFRAKDALLNTGNFTRGHEDMYGGDADLQLNLAHRSSRAQLYLFGGVGRYREQTDLRQVSFVNGTVCGFYSCGPGYFPAITAEQRTTSEWLHAWNAGLGFEVAIADRASFFIEARYLQFLPNNSQSKFIPIRVGFRF
jgi:Outer membrane protein beta-barrel domain